MSPPLIACVPDLITTLGIALQLMSVSDVHRSWTVADCAPLLPPPIALGQFRVYLTGERPVSFASWAFLGPVAREGLRPRSLGNGFIAPYGHTWAMVDDLQRTALAAHIVHATGRKPDGTIRKIGRWTGINVRRNSDAENYQSHGR
jgi:cytolysin-activating lysine-acyltransferase